MLLTIAWMGRQRATRPKWPKLIVCVMAFASYTSGTCGLAQVISVSPSGGQRAAPADDATQRSLAALDLALLAAESGLEDISFEAVRRAAGKGPPVSAVNLGGLLNPTQSQSATNDANALSGQAQIAQRLGRVHEAWKKASVDPDACYRVWKELIFPSARPSEAFPYTSVNNARNSVSYSLVLTEEEPEPVAFGALYLVEWARLAGTLDDLRASMLERQKMPGAQATVNLLRIVLAGDDPSETAALCTELARNPSLLVSDRDAELLMSITYKMLQTLPRDSEARANLWSAVLQTAKSTERWASNQWLKYAVLNETRQTLKQGDVEGFREHADVALSLLAPLSSGGNAEYLARTTSAFYAAAAELAFEAEHMELGIECLKQQTVGGTGGNANSNALVRPNSQITKQLLKLTAQQRYDALFDQVWNMPILGLEQAAQITPQEEIPEPFIQAYKNYRKTDKLPFEQVTSPGSYSMSLLEWMMRDAIELGKLDEIHAKLSELEKQKSDDLALAKLVLDKVQDNRMDLDLVRSQDADGKSVLRGEVAGPGPVLPLDFEIVWHAIQDDASREDGIELAERLAERGFANRTNHGLQGRFLVSLGQLASDNPPATSDELIHFVKADDFSGINVQLGQPLKSFWLEKSPGVWEHQVCASRSMLLFKYPLQGKFDIAFSCPDQTYGESGSTLAGISMDFRGYLRNVLFNTVGLRTEKSLPIENIQRDGLTNYILRRDTRAGTFTLLSEDNQVGTLLVGGDEFPFYGMQSMMHRKMSTHNLEITGDIIIPRSIPLVTPSLLGWSAHFKMHKLPNVDYFPEDNQPASGATQSNTADLPYDWHRVDNRIESVDHARLREIDRANGIPGEEPRYQPREHWLYYVRPLCDGERVDFEFYQEDGKFSVHPTIDRIAIWFDEPEIRQHWITSDNGNWFGVNSTNRIKASEKYALASAELRESEWNVGSLRREQDEIVLSVNGKDIYRQPVDPILGGRFGFFHDPTSFQVRLRNVVLTGDWPEQLPEDLFEKQSP